MSSHNTITKTKLVFIFFFNIFLVLNIFWGAFFSPFLQSQTFQNQIIQETTKRTTINVQQIENKLQKNHRWILYIRHFSCPDSLDFEKNVLPIVEKNNKGLQINQIDISDYSDRETEWNNVIGEKVKNTAISSNSQIKDFVFKYTPSVLFIEKDKLIDLFEGFGGGPLFEKHYFRKSINKDLKEQGVVNAISDVNKIIKKWIN